MEREAKRFTMKRDEIVSIVVLLILAVVLLVGVYEMLWSLSDLLSLVPYFIMAAMIGVPLWGFRERIDQAFRNHSAQQPTTSTFSPLELKQARANLKRFMEQPRRDELHGHLNLVFRPLMSAVLEMKEGKPTLPKAGSVGNYNNPWRLNPKIIAQVVDVFDKYLPLVENEEVRKGWEENKDFLRKGEFWYGKEQRKWLENIERQHTLITWWLHSP
jgi:hypothetical protein